MKASLFFIFITILFSSCNNKESNPILSKEKAITIHIQPFDNFPEQYLIEIEKNLKAVYSNVKTNPSIPFPESSWNHNKSRRRADKLIKFLAEKAKNDEVIIGLTIKDISTSKDEKSDWGVFGLGYKPGKSCIASSFRLKGNKPQKLFKVAIHELGHTQGLPHCPVSNCFMRDAEGKDVLDYETEFCTKCKKVLIKNGWNLK